MGDSELRGPLRVTRHPVAARRRPSRIASVHHLRTRGGRREIDAIIERDDGRIVAVEIKLGRTVEDGDVHHLNWLTERGGDDILDAVVLHSGPTAYRREDEVAVVPVSLLNP